MGSEPLKYSLPIPPYIAYCIATHRSGWLAKYNPMYSRLVFNPGIYLPDYEEEPQEEFYGEEYYDDSCAN